MFKKIELLSLLLVFSMRIFSQVDDAHILKEGIYVTEKEAATNSPSINSFFSFTPQFGVIENKDTVEFCDYIKLNESTVSNKKIFGFSNGDDIYVRIIEYETNDLLFEALNNFFYHRFFKLNYVGKFSFIKLKPDKDMKVKTKDGEKSIRVSNKKRDPLFSIEDVWYFDKKGVFRKATEQAFFFLLKDDKDLSKKFGAEKHKSSVTYVKYLLEMNERYKHNFKLDNHFITPIEPFP